MKGDLEKPGREKQEGRLHKCFNIVLCSFAFCIFFNEMSFLSLFFFSYQSQVSCFIYNPNFILTSAVLHTWVYLSFSSLRAHILYAIKLVGDVMIIFLVQTQECS